ncbi:MAG: type II toxin-antitoxin system RelE/ParE family toxin [Candidatus Rokubacteria bacterium]|nr:type II toxin-antitoxin system RelE/ParE family toxin [Candidatus Rokubacteria bacterium]
MSDGPAWTVLDYERRPDEFPIRLFVGGLDGRNARDAAALCDLLAARGNEIRGTRSKLVEGQRNLFELRGHQVRIFYLFLPGRRIVLLDGIVKQQDRIPAADLARVLGYQADVERRGPAAPRGR